MAGKAPVNSIGVGVGSRQVHLRRDRKGTVAFIPSAMLYSQALSAAGLAKYGNGLYNINPATSISVWAVRPEDLQPDSRGRARSEQEVHGPLRPPVIQSQLGKIYAGADEMPLFETGVVDWTGTTALTKTDLADRQGQLDRQQAASVLQPAGLPGHLCLFQDEEAGLSTT